MGWSALAGAGVSGIANLLGANQTASAASKAAQAQSIAAGNAVNAITGYQGSAQNSLAPYMAYGNDATNLLEQQTGTLAGYTPTPNARYVNPAGYTTDPSQFQTSGTANNVSAAPYATTGNFTQADLENTPGYQFTLSQGLKAVQNSAAARGLGISGAALKGAASYATGLSDQTYNTRFNQQLQANNQNFGQAVTAAGTNYAQQAGANGQNFGLTYQGNQGAFSNALGAAGQNYGMDQTGFTDAQANQTQAFNRLYQAAALGGTAASQSAGLYGQAGTATANALTGAGSAQAAGINAGGQAYGSALSGIGTSLNNGLNLFNSYGLASAGTTTTTNPDGSRTTVPNFANANTFGNSLRSYMGANS